MDDKILNQKPDTSMPIYQEFKPKKKGKKLAIWVIFILISIITIAVFVLMFLHKDKNKEPETSDWPVLTASYVKSSLLARSKISFPDIEKENIINTKDISKDIKEIINTASSTNMEAKGVLYVGGKKGQIVKFVIDKPLFTHFSDVRSKTITDGWSLLFGSRGTLATILEIENKNLTVRVLESEITKESTDVYIQTIQK